MTRVAAVVFALWGAACTHETQAPAGRIVVTITVDWEGAYTTPETLGKLGELRQSLGGVPMTHFVSAGYLTKREPVSAAIDFLVGAARSGDEVAMHLHAWSTLAEASKVPVRSSPSFMSGTDKGIVLDSGEAGFDLDLDTYSIPALRTMLVTSRERLEAAGLDPSYSFRAGGYLATKNMLAAIGQEHYAVDSSAIDFRELTSAGYLSERVREVWPRVAAGSAPFVIGDVLEMPIAAVADYTAEERIRELCELARKQWSERPDKDVFVTFALHEETADEFAPLLGRAIAAFRSSSPAPVLFTTIEKAAVLARKQLFAVVPK